MNRTTPIPEETRMPSMPEDAGAIHAPAKEYSDPSHEALMPFGEAAKAIFVKANGLPAYRKSIRFVRRAD